METKNAEKKETTVNEQKPATAISENKTDEKVNETAKVEESKKTEADKPATSEAEKKQIAAFIKMRKENRELKRKLAEMPKSEPVTQKQDENKEEEKKTSDNLASVRSDVISSEKTLPSAKKDEVDIEEEGKKAIEELANDSDVIKIPGAVIDIIEMIDNNPRLSRLYQIDPYIATREAKNIWKEKIGINNSSSIAKPVNITSGISTGRTDLSSLIAEAERTNPASQRYKELTAKITEELKKQYK